MRAMLLLLLVVGCAEVAERPVATEVSALDPALVYATPDSGNLWLRFEVPKTDNRGTCEYPQSDSAYSSDVLWARVYRERRVYQGTTAFDQAAADSFQVKRGEIVTYWKRVPADTFLVNVSLYKGTVGSCRKYISQVVTPSLPPTPVLLP